MPVVTRKKRQLEEQEIGIVTRRRTLMNRTNYQSPEKKRPKRNETTIQKKELKTKQTVIKNRNSQVLSEIPVPDKFRKPNVSQKVDSSSHSTQQLKKANKNSQTDCEIVVSQISSGKLPSESNSDVVKLLKAIKKVLTKSFYDFSERLQLDFIPTHLYDLKAYQAISSSRAYTKHASSASVYVAKNYLTEDRHVQFIHHVKHIMCAQKAFPGPATILGILEVILKISTNETHKSIIPPQQALVDLYSLFMEVLVMFPTQPLLKSYIEVFQLPLQVRGIRSRHGIFHTMLQQLTDLMSHNEITITKKRVSDQDQLNNFYFWDAHQEEKSSFEHFPKKEKLKRVILVLDLLTHLFENNLAMFLAKYSNSSCLRTCLDDSKRRPLICSVLWESHETITVINSTIKKIILIFVSMVALEYPKRNVKVLSRLLNVVSHALNLHEYPDEVVEYPTYKNISMDLVREIKKIVDDCTLNCEDLIVKVLTNLRSPLLQMTLAHEALQNIEKTTVSISLEVPFDFIRLNKLSKFTKAARRTEEMSATFGKHEEMALKEISRDGLIKLLRIYAEAFDRFYCVKASFDAFQQKTKTDSKVPSKFDSTSFKQKPEEFDLNEKIQLRQVDLQATKQVIISSKETLGFYRKEIKFLMLLMKSIKKGRETKGPEFDELMKLVKKWET